MSFSFEVLQYFLSSGSFAAQSCYSASLCSCRHWQSFFTHHYNVSLCAYYMQYICKIWTWLRLFLVTILNSSEWDAHNKMMFNSLIQMFWFDSFWNNSWVGGTRKVTIIDRNHTTNWKMLPWNVIRHNKNSIFGVDFTS